MSAVNQFYQLTLKLIKILEKPHGDRDEIVSTVEEFLGQREYLLREIVPPYTPEEVKIGKEIVGLNVRLNQLLKAEKISIQKDIKELQVKKESSMKYVNPYQNLSSDGMFYDKRK